MRNMQTALYDGIHEKDLLPLPQEDLGMKLVCRKCQIEFPCETLDDVREIQTMTCGADGGVHMLVGMK